jgi:hypothetical protein
MKTCLFQGKIASELLLMLKWIWRLDILVESKTVSTAGNWAPHAVCEVEELIR